MKAPHRYRIVIICCTLVQIGIAAGMLNYFSRINNWSAVYAEDSRGYVLVSEFLQGRAAAAEDVPLLRYRLFSVVMPLAAAQLGRWMPVPAGFVLLNVLLWIGAALLVFELLGDIFDNKQIACAGALVFGTSLPLIEWGMPVMVDMAAYFLAVLVMLLWLRRKRLPGMTGVAWGLLLGLAILTKPTLLSLLIFVVGCMALDRDWYKGLAAAACAGALVLGMYLLLGVRPADFTMYSAPRHRGIVYVISAAVFCFHWGWYLCAVGCRRPAIRARAPEIVMYLGAWIAPYMFFVHNPRLFFLSFPAVLILLAGGLGEKAGTGRRLALLTLGYVLTSNVLAAAHLYIMRTLKIRDLDGLLRLLGAMLGS